METVKVSRKYQVVMPEKPRQGAHIRPGDRMAVIAKHGILQYVPVRAMSITRDMIKRMDFTDIRDETDRE